MAALGCGGAVEADPQTGGIAAIDLGIAKVSFTSGARLYRHPDFRGNVSFVSDETGSVVAHYRYSAYGLDAVLGAGADDQRFAGRLELGDGLALLGARIYDQLTGRFLSQDPVFSSLNQYAYTLGNPLDFWDPDGAQPQSIARAELNAVVAGLAAVGAAIAFAVAFANAAAPATTLTLGLATLIAAYLFLVAAVGAFYVAFQDLQAARVARLGSQGDSVGVRTASPPTPSTPAPAAPPPASCSPLTLSARAGSEWALALLLPLQLGLGIALLRARRRKTS